MQMSRLLLEVDLFIIFADHCVGANDKKYLRPLKARMFPISFKTDHGSIWEQPRRVYLPALRLAPPEEKRVMHCN